jgi:TPR repeat protein
LAGLLVMELVHPRFYFPLPLLRRLMLVLALFSAPGAQGSEFRDGVSAYAMKEFARARTVFLDLAELGDGPSQYNLGAMALRGEGIRANRGEALGWMLAARENGHDPTPAAVDGLGPKLTAEERASSERILNRFGRKALEGRVLPSLSPCDPLKFKDIQAPTLLTSKPVEYPESAAERGSQAIVALDLVLAADGRLRDPEVVFSIPPISKGGRAFVDAATRSLLQRRYEPARRNGRAINVGYTFYVQFSHQDALNLLKPKLVQDLREAAKEGDPHAEYLLALVRMGEKQPDRGAWPCFNPIDQAILRAGQAGVPEAQLMIGRWLKQNGDQRKAAVWLEKAAKSGQAEAEAAYGLELVKLPDPPFAKARQLIARAASVDEPRVMRHAMAALACSTVPALRNAPAAMAIAKRIRIDKDMDPLTTEAVAAANAGAGNWAEARRVQDLAILRAKALEWEVKPMEERRDRYRAEKPCVEDFLRNLEHDPAIPAFEG